MGQVGLYTDFFGLTERPFTLLPDPDFLFWSAQHTRAFAVLEYGVTARAPITVISGEVGAGKTTLVHALLDRMSENATIGLISNAQGGRGELLQWIVSALSLPLDPMASYVSTFNALQEFVVREYAAGRRVVLIIDEAQNLSIEGLEELRMLTNMNSHKDELMQLILVGQPELRDMISRPEMRQFAQRVAANFHLSRLDAKAVEAYIRHRMKRAGGTGEEFTKQACERIAAASRGVPRLINQLADLSLVYAFAGDERLVMSSTVEQVLNDGVFFAGYLPDSDAPSGSPGQPDADRSASRDGGAAPGAEIAPFRKPR
ncbi:MAG: AAA family ATPase [Rhodobacteraceae bacterium]|jgi:type II secretory pathway predicted ATPase ExeA|nr:AAA family ATPase [Paracoccaceae bacterium]